MSKRRKFGVSLLVLSIFFFLNASGAMGLPECGPTVPGVVAGIESWLALQWDPNNPEEIAASTSVTIRVLNGSPPYTWEVNEQNGFSLEYKETSDLSNTLYADDSSCGTAAISVRDGNSEIIEGQVRCTSSGIWVVKGSWSAVIPRSGYAWDCQCGQGWDASGCYWEEVWCQGECCCFAGWDLWCSLEHCCDYPVYAANFYTLGTTGGIVWGTFVNNIAERNNVTVIENPDYGDCDDSPWDWLWPSEALVEGHGPPCSPGDCGQIIGSDCVRGDSLDLGKPIGVKRIWAYKYECP